MSKNTAAKKRRTATVKKTQASKAIAVKAPKAKARSRRQVEPSSSSSFVTASSDASERIEDQLGAGSTPLLYEPSEIEDAPEFKALSRARGTMTWGTWDTDERPFEERRRDFLFAYPPGAPTSRTGGRLKKQADGSFAPGDDSVRLERFLADSWNHGSLHELLSRFGLRMKQRPPRKDYTVILDPLRDVAKKRNVRLRVLHGGVDVEPSNMDTAKAEYLDRQEKQQAARDVREARARMQRELFESLPSETTDEA